MENDSPVLSEITGPVGPVEVGTSFNLSAFYTDINIASATWYFSPDGEIFSEGMPGTITDEQVKNTFTLNPGVYNVKLEIEDICGKIAVSEFRYIVIYDPNGGFVTGGGWFYSEPGSMPYNKTAEGKANFGFNAKYKNGKNNMNEVDGNTNFQFKEGDFHFKSSSHDDMSLVISGAKATYRGVGTVNGRGSHKFMVTAIDGDLIGKTDKFRIRVWADGSSSDVIYDNELSASENAEATTELGGGSIVIHKPKGGGKTKTQETVMVAQAEVEEVGILSSLMAYPNPMERTAQIEFSLSASATAELNVFDLTGKQVAHLFEGKVETGRSYEVQFDRENLMPGTYVYRLTTDRGQVYTRMLVIK